MEGDEYLLAVGRYLHLNPIRIKKLEDLPIEEKRKLLRAYRWSSYREYAGLADEEDYVDYGPMLALAGGRSKQARRREARRFVEAGLSLSEKELLELVSESPRAMGSEGFLRWVDELYQDLKEKSRKPEDVSFRRVLLNLSANAILKVVSDELVVGQEELKRHRKGTLHKAIAVGMLWEYSGWTKRDIATILGLGSGAASAWQLRKLAEAMTSKGRATRELQGQVRTIRKRLDGMRGQGL